MKTFIVLLLAFVVGAKAESVRGGVISLDATAQIAEPLTVTDAPPHGFFNLSVGKTVGRVDPGHQISIIGKKSYAGFSGMHIWYQLKTGTQSKEKWLYGGLEGTSATVKLRQR